MDIQLFHGDCLEVMKDIPDKSVDLIVTDPPYLMNYKRNTGRKGTERRRKERIDFKLGNRKRRV